MNWNIENMDELKYRKSGKQVEMSLFIQVIWRETMEWLGYDVMDFDSFVMNQWNEI